MGQLSVVIFKQSMPKWSANGHCICACITSGGNKGTKWFHARSNWLGAFLMDRDKLQTVHLSVLCQFDRRLKCPKCDLLVITLISLSISLIIVVAHRGLSLTGTKRKHTKSADSKLYFLGAKINFISFQIGILSSKPCFTYRFLSKARVASRLLDAVIRKL